MAINKTGKITKETLKRICTASAELRSVIQEHQKNGGSTKLLETFTMQEAELNQEGMAALRQWLGIQTSKNSTNE
jgi:hypothetical protein